MRPLRIEPVNVPPDVVSGGADAVVGLEIHALVLDATPQALKEHMVAPGPATIHG